MNSGKASDLAMSHLGSLECHLGTGIVPNAIKRKSLLLQLESSVNAQPFRFRQTSPLLTPAFQQLLHGSPQKGWPKWSCPPTSRLCPAAPGTQLPHVWLRKSLSRKSWSQRVNLKLSPEQGDKQCAECLVPGGCLWSLRGKVLGMPRMLNAATGHCKLAKDTAGSNHQSAKKGMWRERSEFHM